MPGIELAVAGLGLVDGYLDGAAQADLLGTVDAQPWRADLRRRVQHYGWRYDYTRRSVDRDQYLGPLPGWAAAVADRLRRDGHTTRPFNQVIVNEYEPGQGIAAHVDCVPCFDDTIVSISLGSACAFTLARDGRTVELRLLPGSLLVMRDEARYAWRHSIAARKSDLVDGVRVARGRRVSLTFRTVLG